MLRLTYVFRNGDTRPSYVFNRLHHGIDNSGTYMTDPDLVNVEVSESGVTISKKVVPVPRNMRVEVPEIPALSRVAPGEELQETLSIRLPLHPWTPYVTPAQGELGEPRPLPASFQLGFFHTAPGDDGFIRSVRTPHGPAFFFSLAARYQSILEVALPDPVPVRPESASGTADNRE